MISNTELQQRANEDEELYDRFAKLLEADHDGEYVAIARDGQLVVDKEQMHTLERAIEQFGSGNFAFRKIGSRALGRWRTRIGH